VNALVTARRHAIVADVKTALRERNADLFTRNGDLIRLSDGKTSPPRVMGLINGEGLKFLLSLQECAKNCLSF
jgi:hypothetical protein